MNTTPAPAITVLATSARGAHLITDGTKAVWVLPRQVRADGTPTAGALAALASSDMGFQQGKLLADTIRGNAEARAKLAAARREEAKAKAHAPVTVNIARENWRGEHGAAWQVKTTTTARNRFGKTFFTSAFLPKSQVTVAPQADGSVNVTMPTWLLDRNSDMACAKVA